MLTVAVSVAAGFDNLGASIPWVAEHKIESAFTRASALLALLNLRGVRGAGAALAVPAVAFVAGMLLLVGTGLTRAALGHDLQAPTAEFEVVADKTDIGAALAMLLILRAFSAGAAALTGLEAFVNGVPAFRHPKERNAATTLALVGGLGVTMFGGLIGSGPHHRHARCGRPGEQPARRRPSGRRGLHPGPDRRPGRVGGLR